MKQLGLSIDLNRCIGCKTCIVACRNHYDLVDYATAVPNSLPYYLRVESRGMGVYPDVAADFRVVPCQQCPAPLCVDACPEGAIRKDPQTGIVRIQQDLCTGCNAVAGPSLAEKGKFSPCMAECPAHINVQGYLGLAAKGKYREALQLIKQDSPLPAICGRVCHHPCEKACKRADVDAAVAINFVKRYVADLDLDAGQRYVPALEDRKDERVAIIGAGPAGLTCAYYLAQKGYQVTIFEKAPKAGGMLTQAIPAYRLPPAAVEAEIRIIEEMGVTIKTGVEVGKKDVTIPKLRRQGFKAFFVAIGTQRCKRLGVKGEDLDGVLDGLEFLRAVNLGKPPALGARVAVIGGGNVAMDAVRSARRLGAGGAFIAYRRSLDEMPSRKEELEECIEEGIEIRTLIQPVRFIGQGGRVTAMECVKMVLGAPDASGRPRPEPVPGSEFTVEVDAVIMALGQEADWGCLGPKCACELTEQGTMSVDPLTRQSDEGDIFSGGDAVRGAGSVIEAIADGKEAAISIDRYLQGADLSAGRARAWLTVSEPQKQKYDRAGRTAMPRLAPAARLGGFEEVQKGFTADMAAREAGRCLSCGSACIQACPYGVIQFSATAGKTHKCEMCFADVHGGQVPVCAEVCLTDAIAFGELELLRQDAEAKGRTVVEELSKESVLYIK